MSHQPPRYKSRKIDTSLSLSLLLFSGVWGRGRCENNRRERESKNVGEGKEEKRRENKTQENPGDLPLRFKSFFNETYLNPL
jgi:hypothetical protein